MKFIVSSSQLLKQLQVLGGVINTSNTLPILDNFLFELNQDRLTITASDLETSMSASITVESTSTGNIAVPARLLLDTLKTFPEQPLTFSAENNTIEISANNGKYSLAYLAGDEFPKAVHIKDPSKTVIMGDTLANAINTTLFASGNDDLRPVMSGVFFQFSTEGLTFVATDAHKLVKYTRSDVTASGTAEFIMPKKALQILKGILQGSEEDINVEYNETNAQFSFGSTTLSCRLIEGKYPNYEAVIPKENPNVLTIHRETLLNSLRRVSIFSNKTTHQIRLKIAGAELNISAEDYDFSNKAEERLSCSYAGDDLQIGFNSRFLIEMLNNLGAEEISLAMSMPNRAGIITPLDGVEEGEQVTMLVMPVMLND
ncbi:DNA polymerase III subunit beta [Flavobacteriaceae bacterium]|nr:DNA polymerase III subunit beta [Flavobacteriaceae bacterium]MDA9887038.1 DNA polymerase III subunit beta [Flavobacteriaceae bacterium]MDB9821273.1 DNA polymerase III subunit beta [Flavobacteriaceae bacterium]